MRTIKFRGFWKNVDDEWRYAYGNLAIIKKTLKYGSINGIDAGCYISNKAGSPYAYDVRPETIGQFIGLYDEAGHEIYEGDIVQFDNTIMVVKWDDEMARFYFHQERWDERHDVSEDCKILGNIYMDSDLLK